MGLRLRFVIMFRQRENNSISVTKNTKNRKIIDYSSHILQVLQQEGDRGRGHGEGARGDGPHVVVPHHGWPHRADHLAVAHQVRQKSRTLAICCSVAFGLFFGMS